MFGFIESLAKTALNVAVAPVALAVDIVKLPAAALNGKPAFGATEKVMENIKENAANVLEP